MGRYDIVYTYIAYTTHHTKYLNIVYTCAAPIIYSQFELLSDEDIKVGEEHLHLYNNTYDLPTAEGDDYEDDTGGDGVLGIEEEGQEHRQRHDRHSTSKYHNGVGGSNLTQSEEKELKLKRDNYTDYASGI